jgi:hypothetical protein
VGIALAEISIRTFVGLWFREQLRQIIVRLQAFREAVGDDERQLQLLRSGRMTLKFSMLLLSIFFVMTVIVGFAPFVQDWTEFQKTIYYVVSSVVAIGWWFFRRNLLTHSRDQQFLPLAKRANDYTVLDRWLHWFALEPVVVRHLSFELECLFALPKRINSNTSKSFKVAESANGAVYVCGLARSGTTMLLRVLAEINIFKSLKYRDMPFVLAPNLWRTLTKFSNKSSISEERAHGDGILVDFDSPEGFEEVFWRTFSSRTPSSRCLDADEPSVDTLLAFADYRSLVANPRMELGATNGISRRYLSKNNNNLLRLDTLCADTTATVLVVYRNPVATARSLHRQHVRFCSEHATDTFTRTYMRWLVHHEFGIDHLPFCFAVPGMDQRLNPKELNYWLDYWNAVYLYVLSKTDVIFHLVNHDTLRSEPVEMLEAIFSVIGIQADVETLAKQITASVLDAQCNDGFSSEVIERAGITYRALLDSPKNIVISNHSEGCK